MTDLLKKVGSALATMGRNAFAKLVSPANNAAARIQRLVQKSWRPPDCGKTAKLRPVPTHHLVAANALPPSTHTYLLEKD